MAWRGSIRLNLPSSDTLLAKLGAMRKALLAEQRGLPRTSPSWEAIEILIRDIDSFASSLTADTADSNRLNLNADSELPIKRRASGRREGVFHGWDMERGAMTDVSLEEFSERVLTKGRIGKYDVQTLRREILKDGITSRAEADLLIALDRQADSIHFSWSAFFISALTEFAVWQSGRAGYIDADKSEWLLGALAGEGSTDRARRALVAIAQEAECFDEAFFAGPPSTASRRERRDHGVQELGLAA